MKINKNAWHFRIQCFLRDRPESWARYSVPSNLCEYTQAVVFSLIIRVPSIFIVFASVFSVLGFIASATLYVAANAIFGFEFQNSDLNDALMIFGGLAHALCFGSILSGKFPYWKQQQLFGKNFLTKEVFFERRKTEEEKPPSLLIEYLKAKHEKICPTLQFE